MRLLLVNEAVAARRRLYFDLRQADGVTPATGEAGGQPQISADGAAWTNTGIGTLTSIGNGRYYAELTTGAVAASGAVIESRYKSTNTAECPGDSAQVVGFNPATDLSAAVWAAAPAGTPLADIADAVWGDAPAGTPLADIASAVVDDVDFVAVKAVTDRMARSAATMVAGTASGTPTTTTMTAAVDVVPTVANQFKSRLVIFARDTTTTALRGQVTDITASTAPGSGSVSLTFTALTTAPVAGDTFVIA